MWWLFFSYNRKMNENFNRQLIMLDFEQLEDPKFIAFVDRAEFATYLILRRYIWRGGEHTLGLHNLYRKKRLLVAAVGRERIAELRGLTDVTRVSKHYKYLEDLQVARKMRTGRETIMVLGEWFDISEHGDGSKPKEWFYVERRFGGSSDVAQKATSDVQNHHHQTRTEKPHQTWPNEPHQTWRKKPHINREENRESNTVNVNGGKTHLAKLNPLDQPKEQTVCIAKELLNEYGDPHSWPYYLDASRKVPEPLLRQWMSEIRNDGARHPVRAFVHRVEQYALVKTT